MRFKYIFAASLICAFISNTAFAQSLQFNIQKIATEHTKKSMEADAEVTTNTDETSSLVTLEKDRFAVKIGQQEVIYDFADEKIVNINHAEKTYMNISLYAIVAFNIYEKQNREVLGKAMNEVLNSPQPHDFYIESLFGHKVDTRAAENIEVKQVENGYSFNLGDDTVATYAVSGFSVPTEFQPMYKKYLVYMEVLHPMIVNHMAVQKIAFSALSYKNEGNAPTLTEYELAADAYQQYDNNQISFPENYTQKYAPDERLNQIILSSFEEEKKTTEVYFEEMEALLAGERYLEASYVLHEYITQTGARGIENHQQTVQRIFQDAPQNTGTQAVTAVIRQQPKSEEQLEKAIEFLESFRAQDNEHDYILNVFVANYYGMAKQNNKAKILLLEALEENPHLTGAYKDLGDKYVTDYQTPDAWAAYNHMRRISPDHSLSQSISGMEARIKADHPYFFASVK